MTWASEEQARTAVARTPTEHLARLGITLPPVAKPLAAYASAAQAGGLVFTAGQLPMVDGELALTGKVGAEVSQEQATEAARTCALNALAAAAAEAGGLDDLERIVKVVVFVASAPDFTGQPAVADGASRLFGEVFGTDLKHARSAVGVTVLPLNAPVEVEVVARRAVRARIEPLVVSGGVGA